ncbi:MULTISPECIES: hypothetical protein [unclassified Microcoleus]
MMRSTVSDQMGRIITTGLRGVILHLSIALNTTICAITANN